MIAHVRNSGPLWNAFRAIREKYNGNIKWKRPPEEIGPDRQGRVKFRFTLGVVDSHGPGGRLSPSGRAVVAACWHVHGDFFDALWGEDPQAMIEAGGKKLQDPGDNWQDREIGSMMNPMLYSQACGCERRGEDYGRKRKRKW